MPSNFLFILILFFHPLFLKAEEKNLLPQILITEEPQTKVLPLTTFENPISSLRFNPIIDIQERNFAESQADITVRGGIFEGTGISLGSLGLFDPQTGHYTAEIPISPYMLSSPRLFTGQENSIYGFNSTVANIHYGFKEIDEDIRLRIGVGTHNHNLQHIYTATTDILNTENKLNFDIDLARSELIGTVAEGESNFQRLSSRLQYLTNNSQTDLLFALQDKQFSWPNLYALQELHNLVGSSGVESDDINTSLLVFNHRHKYNNKDYLEFTSYYRKLKDDYEFDKYNPGLFNDFKHKSTVKAVGLLGKNHLDFFNLNYNLQVLADEQISTSLVSGDFNRRTYTKFSLMPEKNFLIDSNNNILLSLGGSYDDSNMDSSSLSPSINVSYFNKRESREKQIYVDISRATKVPGYTAIASNPDGGLFRGNQDLEREKSDNFELGFNYKDKGFLFHSALFYRQDNNMVDWTYTKNVQPFSARSANNVDIDVYGFETYFTSKLKNMETTLGYTFLEKDENYLNANVDASFYALNYPKHRAILSFVYQPLNFFEIRTDNQLRFQEDNELRQGNNNVFINTSELRFKDIFENCSLSLGVDNLFKTNYQDIPGVPGKRRIWLLNFIYTL